MICTHFKSCVCVCSCAPSCQTLCYSMDCSPPDSSVHGIFQAMILGCYVLLQGIFLIQGSNPHPWDLLHWQTDSLPLCHLGSLRLFKQVNSLERVLDSRYYTFSSHQHLGCIYILQKDEINRGMCTDREEKRTKDGGVDCSNILRLERKGGSGTGVKMERVEAKPGQGSILEKVNKCIKEELILCPILQIGQET